MKLLFVSGLSVGGAPRSTLELASVLARHGHEVEVLLGRPHDGWRQSLYERGVAAWVKSDRHPWSGAVKTCVRRAGRGLQELPSDHGLTTYLARHPENAYLTLLNRARPDAVIVNSVPRAAWRWIREDLRARDIVAVLYVREDHALTHLTISAEVPDVLVANAAAHADALSAAGFPCLLLPSVIDRRSASVESSRDCVLLVNPIAENDIDLVLALARLRPDIPFVLQESWPLEPAYRAELSSSIEQIPNVELRPVVPSPSEIYRDARFLLATYPVNRPRVVVEAQHNGIPVLAKCFPALAEAIGPGGVLVPLDASPDEWATVLGELWDDDQRYERMSALAREHDARDEMDPERIAQRFEDAIEDALRR
jgi:glycosyltransferase involved in cell wall biosynthesis